MRVVSLLFHDVYESDPGESGFCSPAADRYKLSVRDFVAQLDGLAKLRMVNPDAPQPGGSDGRRRRRLVLHGDRGQARVVRPARARFRHDRCDRPARVSHPTASSRARRPRPRHRNAFRLASDALQRADEPRDAARVVGKPATPRGHRRPRGHGWFGARRLFFTRRRRGSRRGRTANALHLGTNDEAIHRRRLSCRRALHHPPWASIRHGAPFRIGVPVGAVQRVDRVEREGAGEARARRLVRTCRGLDPGAKSVKPIVLVVIAGLRRGRRRSGTECAGGAARSRRNSSAKCRRPHDSRRCRRRPSEGTRRGQARRSNRAAAARDLPRVRFA